MTIRHLTLHQLRIFDVVARHLSFARAAEELHLTPPAVSIQVKQLMEATGHPLFEQIGKKIFLTAAGQTLWAASRDVLGRLEQASQEIAALGGIEKGELKLGIITTAQYFIPRLLGTFCVEHPNVDASLFVGNREALLERLNQNQDDLYILGQPPGHMNVVAQAFADNPLVVVARPDHVLAQATRIEPSALAAFPFISRERGSGTRLTAENFFAEEGVVMQKRMELGSNEAVKQAVAGGLGIAILSAITL
ncbi:MAG: LysR substrate-binding domain-containing protein, partial [Acidiferrobacter sp.]